MRSPGSEQLYRIFEFDRGVPLTLALIGSRVHPEDLASFREMIERARLGDGADIENEYRLLMPTIRSNICTPWRTGPGTRTVGRNISARYRM